MRLATSSEPMPAGRRFELDDLVAMREALLRPMRSVGAPPASAMSRAYPLDELGRMRGAIMERRRRESQPASTQEEVALFMRVESELRTMMFAQVDVEAVERWATHTDQEVSP